jgi:hypothetical protein
MWGPARGVHPFIRDATVAVRCDRMTSMLGAGRRCRLARRCMLHSTRVMALDLLVTSCCMDKNIYPCVSCSLAPGDGTDRVGRFFRASSMIPLPSVPAHAQPTRAMQSSQPHRPCLHSLGLLEARVLQAERSPMLSMRSTRHCAHGSAQGCTHGKRALFADFPMRYVQVFIERVGTHFAAGCRTGSRTDGYAGMHRTRRGPRSSFFGWLPYIC